MNEIKLTAAARRDLENIHACILVEAPGRAPRYLLDLESTLLRLSEMPFLGRPRAELGRDLRSFAVRRHVVFYRFITAGEGGIRVLRVLHGRQDVGQAFP